MWTLNNESNRHATGATQLNGSAILPSATLCPAVRPPMTAAGKQAFDDFMDAVSGRTKMRFGATHEWKVAVRAAKERGDWPLVDALIKELQDKHSAIRAANTGGCCVQGRA